MFHQHPVFIERRQHRRILTLKNSAVALLVFAVLFAAVNIRSERRRTTPGDFGHLFNHEMPQPVAKLDKIEVVKEAQPIDDRSAADPMLLAPMAREQYLHAQVPQPATPVVVAQPVTAAETFAGTASGDTRVAIVGGPEGVTIVKQQRAKPVLSGGFGR